MSAPSSSERDVARLFPADAIKAAVGGVVALALMAGLAIGLPKMVDPPADGGNDSSGEDADAGAGDPLELPAEVAGWAALGPAIDAESPETAEQYDALWGYADETFADAVDVPADSERYIDLATQSQVAIQAYRGADGPLVPATIADPTSGATRLVLAEFGDVQCILDVISGETSPTPQVQEMTCHRTSADLTVRATVLDGASGDAVQELIDGIWAEIE